MGTENIDETARLSAERVMNGGDVSLGEMKYMIAGLVLSVNKLTNALTSMNDKLWTEEHLRGMVKEEVEKVCKAKCDVGDCKGDDAVEGLWRVLGRFLRKMVGL